MKREDHIKGKFRYDPSTYVLQGRAAEAVVAAQLLLRGIIPYTPWVDVGVDLYLSSGCRIQVKSAHLCATPQTLRKNLEGVYRFSFPTHRYRASSNRGEVKEVKYTPRKEFYEYCDIVVLWGIEQSRFWIIPADLLKGMTHVDLGPDNERSFSKDVPQMREMKDLGYTLEEIAKQFGISVSSVNIRLKRAGTKIHLSVPTAKIRACENAWHHILEFGQPEATETQATDTVVPVNKEEV